MQLYTVAFGHPAVHGILDWGVGPEGQNFWPSAALLRRDLSPRPAFEALLRLIGQDWSPHVEGRTDGQGKVQFQGFFGEYTVVTTAGDRAAQPASQSPEGIRPSG